MSFSLPLFPELSTLTGDERHSTGVLPSQQIRRLIQAGNIHTSKPFDADQVQPASIDLRLGPKAFRVRASFLPNRASVDDRLRELAFGEIDLRHPTLLEPGGVYVVPLLEELTLPDYYSAKANPKSTTGRLDILTRVITDFGTNFDEVPQSYRGKLYLELVSQTFSIIVQEGIRLSQLRFWRGKPRPADSDLLTIHDAEGVVFAGPLDEPSDALISNGLWIRVDVSPTTNEGLVGYRAKRTAPAIDLRNVGFYNPSEFWDPVFASEGAFVILDPHEFYILRSKERIQIPPTYAAEMIEYEAKLGEFRVHYAGFFDPGFGYGLPGMRGTPAVLEVRSLGVPYLLEDSQQVARLIFERLLAVPDLTYGPSIGSSYQSQGLSLSKHFRREEATNKFPHAPRELVGVGEGR